MSRVIVLSCVGGGMRGLFGATVLASLEKQRGKLMRDLLTGGYVGGCSTGGLLTGIIAAGVPMSSAEMVYTQDGPKKVFQPVNSAERAAVFRAVL